MGFEYQAELSKHESQTDAAKGFGGKYGVQTDRKDKVCSTLEGVHSYICMHQSLRTAQACHVATI